MEIVRIFKKVLSRGWAPVRGEEGAVFLAVKVKKIGDFLPLFGR